MTLEEFNEFKNIIAKAIKLSYNPHKVGFEAADHALGFIPEDTDYENGYFNEKSYAEVLAETIKYTSKFTYEETGADVTREQIWDNFEFVYQVENIRQIILDHFGIEFHELSVKGEGSDVFDFDVYVPSRNLVIEVTRLTENTGNLRPVDYFKRMNKALSKLNIKLIRFTDEELYTKLPLVCSMIEHNLGVTKNKIAARKCSIVKISNKQAVAFQNENHLNGGVNALENYGLFHNGELLQVISFSKHRYAGRNKKLEKETWEVIRACSKRAHLVQGGTQKIFKEFRRNHPDVVLHTYCDMNISDGNSYAVNGKLIGETEGDLWYVIPNKYSVTGGHKVIRNRMMKIYLHKMFDGFPKRDEPGYKEINSVEFLRQQGIFEYRGAGNLVYELP